MTYVFVINAQPAKSGLFERIVQKLKPFKDKIKYELYRTVCHRDATRFVSECCAKRPEEEICFVACGGDGTISEVAAALVGSNNKYLAVMPYGTGNDFVKYYPGHDFQSIEKLIEAKPSKIDIIKVNDRYSINVCNVGFESSVCAKANAISARGGSHSYTKGLLLSLLSDRFNKIKIAVDGQVITRSRMLLCTLANCRFVGGEYKCAPKAVNDDGLMDICLIHPIPLLKLASLLRTYREGRHLDTPRRFLSYCRGKHVEVTSDTQTQLCLDGEILPGQRFVIDILPRAINLLVPAV